MREAKLKVGQARFEKYEDASGEWRWRIVKANNRIVADSGEGYETEQNVDRAIAMIRSFGNSISAMPVMRANGRPRSAPNERISSVGSVLSMVAREGMKWHGN